MKQNAQARQPLKPDDIRVLARVAGIHIVEEDFHKLAVALTQHLASMDELPVVEMADIESPLVFRVTWDD